MYFERNGNSRPVDLECERGYLAQEDLAAILGVTVNRGIMRYAVKRNCGIQIGADGGRDI